jgi:hypothetical protein
LFATAHLSSLVCSHIFAVDMFAPQENQVL